MDVLSDVLRLLRLSGSVLFRAELSAPWSLAAPPTSEVAPLLVPGASRLVLFHLIAGGACWAEIPGRPPLALAPGHVVVLPYGDRHSMGSAPDLPSTPLAAVMPTPPWSRLPVLTHGGGGETTRVVCGFLHCEEELFNPLLAALPPIFAVRGGEWLETNIRYLVEETGRSAPGTASVRSRLVELLFVEAVRSYLEQLPEGEVGWLAALRDRAVGRALTLLHADPARAWTVPELGRNVGVSRSVLAARFRALLGMAPMQYLTRWRLRLAADLLGRSASSTAIVAAQVGYDSEAAFNRAFKRHLGEPPATWRASHGRASP